jgi:hypothetical protein
MGQTTSREAGLTVAAPENAKGIRSTVDRKRHFGDNRCAFLFPSIAVILS